ncbi:peroxidase-like [Oppia nitens]|uniref:peroxidase-like n=1 Tax=Oppia nitens TaxID=1686743 RepID=UPI0023DC1231|nr:peroxidase-like [Oppia nitens]
MKLLPAYQKKRISDHLDTGVLCELERNVSQDVTCNPNFKYRRIDGKCNNLKQINWGSAFHCQRRLLPPDYSNGINGVRVALDGSLLPNERLISTHVGHEFDVYDKRRNSMQMIWGKVIANDVVKTLKYFGNNMTCCPPAPTHPECGRVVIDDDKYSVHLKTSCMSVTRSLACNTCRLGFREQLTAVPSYLDLSLVYGFDKNDANKLRALTGGLMQTNQSLVDTTILPTIVDTDIIHDSDVSNSDIYDRSQSCNVPPDRPWLQCFKTGDGVRGNQQVLIATLTLILVLRHNQHAEGLAKVNRHWNDELLFREARRLLEAEYNFINFFEYLPSILNKDLMDYFDLNVRPQGQYSQYNPDVNSDVINEFGSATFRFGHSNINSKYPIINGSPLNSSSLTLRYNYGMMSQIWDGNTNGLMRGMCEDRQEATDLNYTPDVKQYVNFSPCRPKLKDLMAIDVSRGRDHGIAPYVYYVEYCSGLKITSWDDLKQLMPKYIISELKDVFKDYRDIDLFIGGLAEYHMKDSTTGPTFACINAIQFYHLKFGDRYYFEHGNQSGSFSIAQLDNIRKTASMANLLCKTMSFESIQEMAFYVSSKSNAYKSCGDFRQIDYNLWTEDVSKCDEFCQNKRFITALNDTEYKFPIQS